METSPSRTNVTNSLNQSAMTTKTVFFDDNHPYLCMSGPNRNNFQMQISRNGRIICQNKT